MLAMRGKIDISKCTFILIYLPFWFSNLVKATNAALHKDPQESKKANKIRYCCQFCGSELTLLLMSTAELPNEVTQHLLLSHVSVGIIPGKWTTRSHPKGDFLECRPSIPLGYGPQRRERGPRNQTLRYFFSFQQMLYNYINILLYTSVQSSQ